MNGKQILDLPMTWEANSNGTTIRDYLKKLLSTLWEEGEGFSGKRPFGDSGWHFDLHTPLVIAGVVEGVVEEDGKGYAYDQKKVRKLISKAIEAL